LSAFLIDRAEGVLRPHGDPVPLRHRPIHITTDATSQHALIAYNNPSAVTVQRLEQDGRIGPEVNQPSDLDTGIFAHEIRVLPSNRTAVLVTRGNDADKQNPEQPGALKVFAYNRGLLSNAASVAPGGGYGFGPRNIAISLSWIYASLERQNKISVFSLTGDAITPEPAFQMETLDDPHDSHPKQLAGAVHVHPNGRFVYVVNRAFGTVVDDGQSLFAGGENSIVVFSVEERSGGPRRIQSIDTRGICPRTFSIDPGGNLLIVGNSMSLRCGPGATDTITLANLSLFAIDGGGRLTFVRKYDTESTDEKLFWMGMV
jgi:6-phosphogluconolactonase (cycloisomerase 2 family)